MRRFIGIKIIVAVLCFGAFCGALVARAQTFTERVSVDRANPQASEIGARPNGVDLTQRVTLDLRNMEVSDALRYISLRSGMNIVTSKLVTGKLSFQLKDVTLKDVFDVTLLSNGLAYEKQGEIYYVMTEKEYELRYGKSFSDTREVKVFRLKYAIPAKAFDLLDALKSKIGRILVDQESGTVLLMDTAEKIKEMEDALESLETKSQTNIYDLKYASAKDVVDQLKNQLDKKNVGSIFGDDRTNQVVVQTLPQRMRDIEEMIGALDKKTKEVLIDAQIIKIALTDDNALGVEWEGLFQEMVKHGAGGFYFLGNHPLEPIIRAGKSFIDDIPAALAATEYPAAGTKTTGTESIYLGRIHGKQSFEAVINYLQTLGDTKILSNPKISVINNQEAIIHVGTRQAYITTTTTTGQATTTTAEEVTFIDVGIKLSVTPVINDDGFVTMKIKPEISSVIDHLVTPSGNEIPIVDTSMAETTVMVKDGTTIVIGGLRKDETVKTEERIPFFSSIPFIGDIFTNKTNNKERTELLVMLTPHIVGGDLLVTGDKEKWEDEHKPVREYGSFESLEKPKGIEPKSYKEY